MAGIAGGATNFFYDYDIDIYPFGQFLVFLYPLLISYAVIRHQAMDIGMLLRRTGLFIFIYLVLVGLIIPIPVYIHHEIHQRIGFWSYMVFLEIFLVGGVLSLGPFIYAYLVHRSSLFHENTLAGLTHELKSPLSTIESALDVLNNQVSQMPADPKQSAYLEMIGRNADRLRQFVDDLLIAFKQTDKSRLLDFQQGDLGKLLKNACESAGDSNNGTHLKIECNVSEQIIFRFDEKRVEQVVSNIISNAVKFTRQGVIRVFASDEGSAVRVDITDTGAGIPSEELPYVFDRFFQGEKGRRNKGTGIGLYVAKAWVEAHGGAIGAESEGSGKGSRFWFRLPK